MTDAAYDAIADWYDRWVGELDSDPMYACVDGMVGDVARLLVCDLACGQGRGARHLAARGARVVGVDISRELLARAQARGSVGGAITYVFDDALRLSQLSDAAFDGVLCHLALMDIPDLTATLRAVARVLRPGGWFVFSVLHPCFQTPSSHEEVGHDGALWRLVNAYWAEGFWRSDRRPGPPDKVGAYHRTLATYANELVDAGFPIERVAEPRAVGSLAENRPIWTEVPAFLVVRCRKGAGPGTSRPAADSPGPA